MKKNLNIKHFFHIKTFFSANNVYFVKNTNIFSKTIFFQPSFAANEQPQPVEQETSANYKTTLCEKPSYGSLGSYLFAQTKQRCIQNLVKHLS